MRSVIEPLWTVLVLAVVGSSTWTQAAPRVPTPGASALGPQSGLASISILAVKRGNVPAVGLAPRELRLHVDKKESDIVSLSRNDTEPLTICLLVDASLRQRLPFFRPNLEHVDVLFKPVLDSGGSAIVAAFGDSLAVGKRSSEPAAFATNVRWVRTLWIGHRTALFDAVRSLCQSDSLRSGQRKAMIVVSDGDDNASKSHVGDAVRSLEATNIQVFFLLTFDESIVGYINHLPWMLNARDAAFEMASRTGGVAFTVKTDSETSRAFRVIASDLSSEYTLTFHSPGPGLHKIEIRSLRSGVKILSQHKYLGK